MRVTKPMSLSLLTRPFEYRRRIFLGIGILGFVPLSGNARLLSEMAMWKMASEVLGSDMALDAVLPKQRGELLVSGSAWSHGGVESDKSRVEVRLGGIRKVVNVIGDRVFENGRPGFPKPFRSIPLEWSRAFGGPGYARNPLGRGLGPQKDEAGQKVHPLPNIEYPQQMMGLPGQRPEPAGLGPVDILWPQRQEKAGTYDRKWLETDFPGLAADVDWSFFNIASRDQQQDTVFRGDEAYEFKGVHPEHRTIQGSLPGFQARCFIRKTDQPTFDELSCKLTTAWFFPDRDRLILIYHACAEITDPYGADIGEVIIGADHLARPRPAGHYIDVFNRRMDDEQGMLEMLDDRDLIPEGTGETVSAADEAMADSAGGFMAANFQARARQQREHAIAELEKGQARLAEELGSDVDFPDPAEAFGPAPDDAPLPPLADLSAYIQQKNEAAEARFEAAQVQRKESQERLEAHAREENARAQESGMDMPNLDPAEQSQQTGPPSLNAAEKEREIREAIESMRAQGLAVDEMEAQLLDSEFLAGLGDAERKLRVAYQLSAHLQSPAPRSAEAAVLGRRLHALIASGQSVEFEDFTGADLTGLDFAGADLRGVFVESALLAGVDLSGARLDGAVLAHADLTGACLSGASLRDANLGNSTFTGVQADGADFGDAIFYKADLTGSDFTRSRLDGADMTDVVFKDVCLVDASARDLFLMKTSVSGIDFSGSDLSDAIFIEVDLGRARFSGATLDEAVFLGCTGQAARFDKASLKNLRVVESCDLSGADFTAAVMEESNLRGTRLMNCNFAGANLARCDFSQVQAGGSSFHRAIGVASQWMCADLRDCDLSGMNLMQASLERADIRGASLKGANLFQVDLSRVHVDRKTNFDAALTKKMRTYPRKFPKEA